MKKSILTITFILISVNLLFSQAGLSEYRYFGIKAGIVHNASFPLKENNFVLINSPIGNLTKFNNSFFSYAPGANFSLIYNFDSKNNKTGIILGAEVGYIGFSNSYKSDTLSYLVNESFRVLSVGFPLLLKIGSSNIYKNQLYATLGVQYNLFFMPQHIQRASWNEQLFVQNIQESASRSNSISLVAGFNYNIYFFQVQLLTKSFVNEDFTTIIEEGSVRPYQHINLTNNLYITTGVNIPLTRWLTARNWTAEKIRRFFKGSN